MKEIAIVGRTGDPQPGMTLKWAKAGRKIVIDSYKEKVSRLLKKLKRF